MTETKRLDRKAVNEKLDKIDTLLDHVGDPDNMCVYECGSRKVLTMDENLICMHAGKALPMSEVAQIITELPRDLDAALRELDEKDALLKQLYSLEECICEYNVGKNSCPRCLIGQELGLKWSRADGEG